MQASLHQKIGFSGAHELDGFLGGSLAVRHVDDLNAAEVERKLLGDRGDLVLGADEDGFDQSRLAGFDRASQRGLVARMGHGGGDRLKFLCRGDQAVVLFVPTQGRRR